MNHRLSPLLRDANRKPRGQGSRGRFAAIEEPRGAVIFVHGFKGSAIDTWLDFPFALERESRVEDYDLLFYGYDTREQAGPPGADLQ